MSEYLILEDNHIISELMFADILRLSKDKQAPIAKVFDINAALSEIDLSQFLITFNTKDMGPQGSQRIHDTQFQINKRLDPARWKVAMDGLYKIKNNKTALRAFILNGFIKHGHVNYYCSCECFVAETEIKMLDGTVKRIGDLEKGQQYWIYSSDDSGNFIPKLATALGVTKTVDQLVEVTLDNGKTERCSLNHKWRLRDGSYKMAKDLVSGDSLMPLYTEIDSKGYEVVLDNDSKKKKTHTVVNRAINDETFRKKLEWREQIGERCLITHHKDANKTNNTPDNLEWMGVLEHWKHHAEEGTKRLSKTWDYWKDEEYYLAHVETMRENGRKNNFATNPEVQAKASESIRKSEKVKIASAKCMKEKWANPEFREKTIASLKISIKEKWQDPKFIEAFKRGREKDRARFVAMAKSPENKKRLSERTITPKMRTLASERLKETWEANREIMLANTSENGKKTWEGERGEENRKAMSIRSKSPEVHRKQRITRLFSLYEHMTTQGVDLTEKELRKIRRGKKFPIPYAPFDSFEDSLVAFKHKNHKVASVRIIDVEPTDLYDLFVPDTHNFALASGVYVHNSFLYGGFAYISTQKRSNIDVHKEPRPPHKTNPLLKGAACKHVVSMVANIAVFADEILTLVQRNLSVAPTINNTTSSTTPAPGSQTTSTPTGEPPTLPTATPGVKTPSFNNVPTSKGHMKKAHREKKADIEWRTISTDLNTLTIKNWLDSLRPPEEKPHHKHKHHLR